METFTNSTLPLPRDRDRERKIERGEGGEEVGGSAEFTFKSSIGATRSINTGFHVETQRDLGIYDSYFDRLLVVSLISRNHLFRHVSINHRPRSSRENFARETSSISPGGNEEGRRKRTKARREGGREKKRVGKTKEHGWKKEEEKKEKREKRKEGIIRRKRVSFFRRWEGNGGRPMTTWPCLSGRTNSAVRPSGRSEKEWLAIEDHGGDGRGRSELTSSG